MVIRNELQKSYTKIKKPRKIFSEVQPIELIKLINLEDLLFYRLSSLREEGEVEVVFLKLFLYEF
jgi:hypothetical protein